MARTIPMRAVFSLNTKPLESSLGVAGGKMTGFADHANRSILRVNSNFTGMFSNISSGSAIAIGALGGVAAAVGGITAAVNIGTSAWQRYGNVDTMRRRSAAAGVGLGGTAQQRLGQAQTIGEDISKRYGIKETAAQQGLKDILGLNVDSWNQASELLEIAAREWWYSGADMSTTAADIKGQSELWGKKFMDAADEMAATVQIAGAGTTMASLGRAQGFFMAPTKQAGITSQLGNAMFAGLTQLGVKPEQAGTRIAALMRELATTDKGIGGLVYRETGKKAGELDERELVRLIDRMYQTRNISEISSSAEVQGALALFENGPHMVETFYSGLLEGVDGRFEDVTDEVLKSSEVKMEQWRRVVDDAWNDVGQAVAEFAETSEFDTLIDMFSTALPMAADLAVKGLQGFLDMMSIILDAGTAIIDWIPGVNIQQFEPSREGEEAIARLGDLLSEEEKGKLAEKGGVMGIGIGAAGQAGTFFAGSVLDAMGFTGQIDPESELAKSGVTGDYELDNLARQMDEAWWESRFGTFDLGADELREAVAENVLGPGFEAFLADIVENTKQTAEGVGEGNQLGEEAAQQREETQQTLQDGFEGEKDRALFFSPVQTGDFARIGP